MVMRDRPQALFQPRMHPKRTAVEIVSALEAGLKKSGEKSGLEAHTYDAQNRGLTSARAYGADSVSLVY